MAVRSTYSSKAALEDILTALSPLSNLTGLASEATMSEVNNNLGEVAHELRKIRTGHELFLWEEEVEEVEE